MYTKKFKIGASLSKKISIIHALALLFLFDYGKAEASCGAGYEGVLPQGQMHIGAGDCDYEEIMIVVRNQGANSSKAYPYKNECFDIIDKNGKHIGFSCRKDGQSPLAGSRYRLRTFPKKNGVCGRPPLRYYECIHGCNSSTPKIFEDHTVECD